MDENEMRPITGKCCCAPAAEEGSWCRPEKPCGGCICCWVLGELDKPEGEND
jgi:hypothetical protein